MLTCLVISSTNIYLVPTMFNSTEIRQKWSLLFLRYFIQVRYINYLSIRLYEEFKDSAL